MYTGVKYILQQTNGVFIWLICVCFQQTPDAALILSLSLSELTKQLREELLTPEDVFYSYMQKVWAGTEHNSISKSTSN